MFEKNIIQKGLSIRQAGIAHLMLLIAVVGLVAFLLISNTFDFKNKIFNALFPKPASKAAENLDTTKIISNELLVKLKPEIANVLKGKVETAALTETGIASFDESLKKAKVKKIEFVSKKSKVNKGKRVQNPNFSSDHVDRWFKLTLANPQEKLSVDGIILDSDPKLNNSQLNASVQSPSTSRSNRLFNLKPKPTSESSFQLKDRSIPEPTLEANKNLGYGLLADSMKELKKNSQIEVVEPNYIYHKFEVTTNDFYFNSPLNELWDLKRINISKAWDLTMGSKSTVVAVVDSGIDYTHPDLLDNIWINPGESGGKENNGIDDDSNGFIDDYRGYDFVTIDPRKEDVLDTTDNDPMDELGHGTHVAGIIGALGNNDPDHSIDTGKRMVGVSNISLMAVKGLNANGEGLISDLGAAIRYVTDNGADVINMSWGGMGKSQFLDDQLQYSYNRGVVLIAAAGNSAINAAYFSPASSSYVITVASSNDQDSYSCFSNFGFKIDLSAPGGDSSSCGGGGKNILSTISKTHSSSFSIYGCCYAVAAGTSMATPHVAGTAALLLTLHPDWTQEMVRQALRKGSDDIGPPGFDLDTGYGRLDVFKTLSWQKPLSVKITYPTESTLFSTTNIQISGIVSGENLSNWKLEYASYYDQNNWQLLNSATVPVNYGLLKDWDITSLLDKPYILKLTATDQSGIIYEDRVAVVINQLILDDPPLAYPDNRFRDFAVYNIGQKVVIKGTAAQANLKNYQVKIYKANTYAEITNVKIALTNDGLQKVRNGILGTWDTSGLAQDMYIVELRANLSDGSYSALGGTVLLDNFVHSGWPKKIFDYEGSNWYLPSPYGHLITEDIDGDGKKDLLTAYGDKVVIYNGDGGVLSGWPQTVDPFNKFESIIKGPTVGDLDNDGKPEIVAAANSVSVETGTFLLNDALILIWRSDGTLFPGWPKRISGIKNPFIVLSDVDDDGQQDIVLESSSGVNADPARITVLRKDGSILPGWPRDIEQSQQFKLLIDPAVSDLNGDGKKEIIIADDRGPSNLYILDYKGGVISGWPKPLNPSLPNNTSGILLSNFVIGDIDNDGKPEIVAGNHSGVITAYKIDGSIVLGWPVTVNPSGHIYPVVIGDLDNDGKPEIVAGTSKNYLYVFRGDGTLVPGWPKNISVTYGGSGFGYPVLADTDGDDLPEIIVVSSMDLRNPFPLHAYKLNGQEASGFPKPLLTGDDSRHNNSPVVGDFDGDGFLELAFIDGTLRLNVWDLVGPVNSNQPWPMFMHDPQKTGVSIKTAESLITSCAPAKNTVGINEPVIWSAQASGGTGSYQFSWSGADGLTGASQSVTKSYASPGIKNASVAVSSGTQAKTANCVVTVADNIPPAVSITFPGNNQTVLRTFNLTANASDNVAVAGVQFKMDGVNLGPEDTTAPYSASWNTKLAANAVHTLTAVARDSSGNTTTSSSVTVTVDNSYNRAFITKSTFNGSLGGLSGGDSKCQQAVNSLTFGGTFKAWLSDSVTSVSSRLNQSSLSYKLLNPTAVGGGTIIANNWTDLVDGTLLAPINIDETGNTVAAGRVVWTNTNPSGGIDSTSNNCSNFSSSNFSYKSGIGKNDQIKSGWTTGANQSCDQQASLYCFEQ
ncbi:S8 family serine peptidase [Candidatus Daviesbacteria bacterium]|nr:S8 family serine peptidase [Candidatus Daviesbacteria bacterium]